MSVVGGIIVGFCLIVGVLFGKYTDHIDHPVEEMVESVLESKGIDVDFSADKKEEERQKHLDEVDKIVESSKDYKAPSEDDKKE